jgi:hypothetical protein
MLTSVAAWIAASSRPAIAQSPGGAVPSRSNMQTRLLFLYVTNQNGFDTEFDIANTTMDAMGTSTTNGTCTLTFYGTAAVSPFTTPLISAGSVYRVKASAVSPNFTGYAFATCGFPLAHGSLMTMVAPGYSSPIHASMAALVVPSIRNSSFAEQLMH